jgi:hypothetical protein
LEVKSCQEESADFYNIVENFLCEEVLGENTPTAGGRAVLQIKR